MNLRKETHMITTFEELFEKMKADGKNWIPLHNMYHSYLHWYGETKKESGSGRSTAHSIKNRDAENLMGYLSCLRDLGYISESEYGKLWGSLDNI